ncbi:hypothetical protein GCM10027614_00460 [Micromonospora vulcania]
MGLHAQCGCAHDEADRRRGEDREQSGRPESQAGTDGEDGRGVRPDPEERDLGQVDLPGDAHGQAEADRQDRVQQHDVDHVHRVRVELVREQPRGHRQHRRDAEPVSHARFTVLSPKMPVGLIMMIMVKIRNVTSSE